MKALHLLPILALGLTACAKTIPSPVEQRVTAERSVRAAEEAGGDADPQALLYLKLAREQLAKGKEMMDAEDAIRADRSLRRAEADGELARGIARRVAALKEAAAAKEALAKIKADQ